MYNSMELLQLTVSGNCDICKDRIEAAAKAVRGVLSANWDIRTSKLLITIETGKTTLDKVSEAIARAGHNTERHTVEEIIHNSLPDCCKYIPETMVLANNAV